MPTCARTESDRSGSRLSYNTCFSAAATAVLCQHILSHHFRLELMLAVGWVESGFDCHSHPSVRPS